MAEKLNINPNEDPVYRKKVYKFLSDNFSDFTTAEQDFYKKLDTDQTYAPKVYKLLKDNFSDFDSGEQDFMFLMTPSKKKDQAGLPAQSGESVGTSQSPLQLPSADPNKSAEDNVIDLGEASKKAGESIYAKSQSKISSLTKDYEDYVNSINQQIKDGVIVDRITAEGLVGHKRKRYEKAIEEANAEYQASIDELNNLTQEERKKILNPKNRKVTIDVGASTSEGENAKILNEYKDLEVKLNSIPEGDKLKDTISQELKNKKKELAGRLGIGEDDVDMGVSGNVYSDVIGSAPKPEEIREYSVSIRNNPVNASQVQSRRKSGQLFYENTFEYLNDNPKAASRAFSQTFTDLPDQTGVRKASQYDFELNKFMIETGKQAVRGSDGVVYNPENAAPVDVSSIKEQYDRNLKGLSQQLSEKFIKLTPSSDDLRKLESGEITEEEYRSRNSYENIVKSIQKQYELVDEYVLNPEEKQSIQQHLGNQYTFLADVLDRFGGKSYREKNPLYVGLNDYQKIYLEKLKIANPEKYEGTLRLLTTPAELIKQETGEWNPELESGYQGEMKKAEDEGIKLASLDYQDRISSLISKSKSKELTAQEKIELAELTSGYEDLEKLKSSQIDRYPAASKQEIIDLIGKSGGDVPMGKGERFLFNIGRGISSGVDWAYELITSPISNEDSRITDLQNIGDDNIYRSKVNVGWEEESVIHGDLKYALDPEFNKQIKAIDQNDTLSQGQKYDAKVKAFLDYRKAKGEDPVVVAKNEKAGDLNLTASSISNVVGDVSSQIISQFALAMMTGGAGNISKARSLATLFGTTFATSMRGYEVDALREGRKDVMSYAIRRSTIDALTELYGDDLMRIKGLFKGKGTLGKIVESVTDAEWKAALKSTKRGVFNNVKNVISSLPKRLLKPAFQETSEEVSANILNNLFEGKPLSDGLKETIATTSIGTFGAFGLGLPFQYRSITNSQKMDLFNAGLNANKFLKSIESDLANGAITQEEAEKRRLVINEANSIIRNLPKVDENGNKLSDKALVNLAFNKYTELQAQKAKKENPKSQKIDQVIDEIQQENADIFSGVEPEVPQQTLFEQISKRIEEIDAEEKGAAGEVKPEVTATPKEITEQEYSEFIDKGIVNPERLNDIAQKVKNQEKLSEREQEIFTDKTADINKIIAGEVAPEVPQTVEQLRAAEQAEYAAMPDPNDEVKRQEIYDKYDKLITPLLEKEKEVSEAAPVPSIIEVKSPKEVKQGDTVVWRGEDFTVEEVNAKGGFNLQNKKDRTWTVKDARITDEEFQGKRGEAVPEAKPKVPAKTTSDVVADDLLNFLGIKPDGGEVKFSKTTGQPEVIKPVDEKEKEVIDRMNSMNLVNEGVELGAPSTTSEKIDVDELNSRLDTPLEKINWDDYEGIPFAFTISDQLRSGDVTNPATGEVIKDLKGGIGFNGTAGNEGNAWANTSKDEADALKSKALDVYNANKPLFEKLWAEGRLPDGHIPVAVVKMAESAILSNEAVFRVGIQNIKTLPERNREKAIAVLNKTLKQKAAQIGKDIKRGTDAKTGAPYSENTLKAKKKLFAQYNRILDVLNKYGYKDIVDVLEDGKHFSLPEKAIITSEVFYGAPTPIGGKPIDINRSRPSTPVSVALIGNKNPELINIGRITDLLTEPSMKNIPNMHVVSIVAVDVKNPQTTETNHPNYKFGVKGQSIGILESPVHMKDAFGEAYGSAISQITKNEASNASINAKQAMTQGIPVQAGLPNRVLKGAIAKKNLDAVDKLTGFLRQAFPSTTFFTSQEAWDAAMADPSVKKKLKDGEVVYAFTTDGNVFINPNLKTTKAALHETGHIWMEFVKDSNPELHNKGLALVDGTKEFEKAKEQYGDTPLAREEALMELMSSKGDTIVNASQKAKFKEWLLSIYKYISESFTSLLGLSPKEIENLTLDKFLEGMLADILSGKEVSAKKIKGEVKLSAESITDRIKKFIDLQRSNGISDVDIKAGIEKVAKSIGLSASDINNLMAGEFPTKPKEYAVQEQAAGEVPVQPKAGVSEEVEGGVPGAKPQAAPEEGKAEGEEEKVKPSGIKKGLVSQEVLSRVNLNTVGDKELLESGKAIIESGEVKPKTVVNRVIDGGQGVLTPAEVVAMITYKADLDTKQEDLSKEIERRTKAGEDLGDLLVEYKDLQVEIDNYDIAAVITAQQQSLAFRLRRYLLDREYNITVQINRYKQTNGGTIPESVLAKFKKLNETIKDLRKKIKEAEAAKYEEDSKAAMQNIIEDVERENQANGPKLYTEQELEDKVKEGVQKEIDGIYAKMPAEKKSKAQRVVDALDNIQRKLRSKTYDASLGVPVAFIDAGITAIKNAIKLGIEVEKAIEIGIKTIKDKLNGAKWDKEADFRKDMMEGFKEEGVDVKKTKEVKARINDDGTITIPNKDIRDFVSQGIEDIDDLADAILNKYQAELPGVSSRQVRDSITKYGKEVSQTRDDISIKLGRAKRVGRLLSELEDLRTMDKGAFLLKYQRVKPAKDKISEREKNLKYLIRQLGREIMGDEQLPENYDEQKALDTAKNRVARRIEELRDKIKKGDFSKKQKRRVQADQELVDLQSQLEKTKSEFDLEHEKNEQKNKKWYQKAGDFVLELFSGIPRTLVTGFDFGIVFTQGIRKVFTNPVMSAKAFVEAGKQFFSESRQKKMENELKVSGAYALIKNSGLSITEGVEKASAQEQIFIVNYVNLIWDAFARVITLNYKPGTELVKAMNPFKASQRFFDGYLNYIRINSFLNLSNAIDKNGYTPETHPEIYKAAAEFVNTTTGKGAKNIPKSLGFLMFSASKVASELKLYTPYAFYYYAKMPKAVRNRAMLEFGTFALSFSTAMLLLRAALDQGQGDDEDDEFWDINSSNFLTFKFGNQRVSFAAGARPTLVFMGRLFSGVYVDQYGQESKLGERTGKQINTKFDLIVRFFTAKAAPVPAAAIQYLDKKAGVEVEDDVFKNLVLPMWLQDSQELYAQNPKEIGALYTLLSLIGANIRTVEGYTEREYKMPKKIFYTDDYSRKREVVLTDEQKADFQKMFDEKFKKNIEDIKNSESYKNLTSENDKIFFDVTFGKKAKDDAESDAKKELIRKYRGPFSEFPIIRETPEEKEINRILNRGEKKP